MWKAGKLLIIGAVTAVLLPLGSIAGATTAATVEVLEPAPGAVIYDPTGPVIKIQFSDVTEPRNYTLRTVGTSGGWEQHYVDPANPASLIWTPHSGTGEGSYHLEVVDATSPGQEVVAGPIDYTVVRYALWGGWSDNPFYPLHHDRYKDTSTFATSLSQQGRADFRLTLRSARTGRIVRTWRGDDLVGDLAFEWNGRDRSGHLVNEGRYVMHVVATPPGGPAYTRDSSVVVAERVIKDRINRTKNGSQGRTSKSGNCDFTKSFGEVLLTCLGGTARASYAWQADGKARDIDYGFRAHKGIWPCKSTGKAMSHRGTRYTTTFSMRSSRRGRQCWISQASFHYTTIDDVLRVAAPAEADTADVTPSAADVQAVEQHALEALEG